MGYVYDMHCHLIPGVDDGSESIEESLEALHLEYDQGVRHVMCTPHYSSECEEGYGAEVRRAFEELEEKLKQEDIGKDMHLYLGQELMYTESLIERLETKRAWTLAGSHYVLVEFFPMVSYEELYRGLRRLVFAGYLPILAHMERYRCLFKQKERLKELEELEIYLQINGSSLFGGAFDLNNSHYVRKLCKAGKIHFLGTDSHGIHYRKPILKRAVTWIENNCTEICADRMLYENPRALLADEII